jgi:hypothetical protein
MSTSSKPFHRGLSILAVAAVSGLGLPAVPPKSGPEAAASSSSTPASCHAAASSSSSAAPAPGLSLSWPQLEAAYRADLANIHYPMHLDVVEGEILAKLLQVGAEIYQVLPGRPATATGARQIVHRANINAKRLREFSAMRLLTGLFFMANERFPSQDDVLDLRNRLAAQLKPKQIRSAVQEMIRDLIDHASEREWADGRFPTWGPNLSALLLSDPVFVRSYEQARASSIQEQKQIENQIMAASAASGPVQPLPDGGTMAFTQEVDEDADLEAALRASKAELRGPLNQDPQRP